MPRGVSGLHKHSRPVYASYATELVTLHCPSSCPCICVSGRPVCKGNSGCACVGHCTSPKPSPSSGGGGTSGGCICLNGYYTGDPHPSNCNKTGPCGHGCSGKCGGSCRCPSNGICKCTDSSCGQTIQCDSRHPQYTANGKPMSSTPTPPYDPNANCICLNGYLTGDPHPSNCPGSGQPCGQGCSGVCQSGTCRCPTNGICKCVDSACQQTIQCSKGYPQYYANGKPMTSTPTSPFAPGMKYGGVIPQGGVTQGVTSQITNKLGQLGADDQNRFAPNKIGNYGRINLIYGFGQQLAAGHIKASDIPEVARQGLCAIGAPLCPNPYSVPALKLPDVGRGVMTLGRDALRTARGLAPVAGEVGRGAVIGGKIAAGFEGLGPDIMMMIYKPFWDKYARDNPTTTTA